MNSKPKSLKMNFIYSFSLKILNIIFPLITFPYVARILSAEGIGRVDFSLSLIQYFILLSQVGIPTYAIRECSKHRDNKENLSRTVQEILTINLIMIVITYLIFFVVINNVNDLYVYKRLLIIMSFTIISTSIGIEWFYQAIENYRYITIINLIVKIITLIAVFVFVKSEEDYLVYGLITVLALSTSYIFNFFYARKYIDIFRKYKNFTLKRHIKPIMMLFAMSLSISIYINLDKVMLGIIHGDRSVGLYASANRIIMVVIALVTSLGTVLLPRMSYYIENSLSEQIDLLIRKSHDFILMVSIPATIGIFMLAKPIVLLFAGQDYADAIISLKIVSPTIIAMGLSNLIGIQILVSHGKEKLTVISTIIGATVNFSLNLILIPIYQQNGAAFSTFVAELSVTIIQIILAYKYLKGNIIYKNLLFYLLGGGLIVLICEIVNKLHLNMLLTTSLSVLISSTCYFILLYFSKNELIQEITASMKKKIMNISS
ncbi:flippase [Paenibacillus sp. IHBB 3054]|uniref:flippase n=1 Tax=Paenibacillus sp. IHBB 3054 TaxID=3425689 RepID=UPI003F66FD34